MSERKDSRWLKILVGLIITALALWLSFRNLDWQTLKRTLFEARLIWIILALGNSLLTVYFLGVRWYILLKPEVKISLNNIFRLNIISQCVNILMPARFGEVLRAYLASRQYKISGAYVMGTVVIEKALDFFLFVALWILLPVVFAMHSGIKSYEIAVVFCLLTLGLLVLFVFRPREVLKFGMWFSRLIPKKYRGRFVDFFEKGLSAFSQLKNMKTTALLLVLTFVFVGGQVLTNYFLFKACRLPLSIGAALFLLLILQVGNIPPSVPGKIGIFEYAVILALSVFSVGRSQALSYGLVLHVVAFLPKIVLGLIFMAQLDISLRKKYIINNNEN